MVPFSTMNVLPMRALPPLVLSADAPVGGPEPLPLDQRQGSALWPVPGDFALGGQVAERQLQAWEADQQEEEEEEEARQAEQLTDALLQQEAKMMTEQGYRPKVGSAVDGATAVLLSLALLSQTGLQPRAQGCFPAAQILPCSSSRVFLPFSTGREP